MLGKRIMYPTMNRWNGQDAPAYNMKIYNVIPAKYRNRAFDIYYDEQLCFEVFREIGFLCDEFKENNYPYSVAWNGKQGGYLVLYKGDSCAGFTAESVPADVLKNFRKLANDIIKTAIYYCKLEIEETTETYTEERKVRYFKNQY